MIFLLPFDFPFDSRGTRAGPLGATGHAVVREYPEGVARRAGDGLARRAFPSLPLDFLFFYLNSWIGNYLTIPL